MTHTSIEEVLEIRLRHLPEPGGTLVPIQGDPDIPFDIQRVFWVFHPEPGVIRGKHAHHLCEQVLVALSGKLIVICRDGENEKTFTLDEPTKGLYLPTGIWSEEKYMTKDTILFSICSNKYAKADYICDWEEYVEWRNS